MAGLSLEGPACGEGPVPTAPQTRASKLCPGRPRGVDVQVASPGGRRVAVLAGGRVGCVPACPGAWGTRVLRPPSPEEGPTAGWYRAALLRLSASSPGTCVRAGVMWGRLCTGHSLRPADKASRTPPVGPGR